MTVILRVLFGPAYPEVFSKSGAHIDPRLEPRLAVHVAFTHPLDSLGPGQVVPSKTCDGIHESACRELGRLLSSGLLNHDAIGNTWRLTAVKLE